MMKRILVPLDGSVNAECALPHAVALARAFDAEVAFLHVMDPAHLGDPSQAVNAFQWRIDKSMASVYLDSVNTRLASAGLQMETAILEGRAHERITAFAADFDLTILSSHGQGGLAESGLGSITQKVLPRLAGSALLVRPGQPVAENLAESGYRRILILLDGSWRAESALPLASSLAQSSTAQLQVVHVVGQPEMPRRLPLTDGELDLSRQMTESNHTAAASYLDQLRQRLPAQTQFHLVSGETVVDSVQHIVEEQGADLVLLCAHGYSGDNRRTYGSIASSLIAYGATPLLIVQDMPAQSSAQNGVPTQRSTEVPRYAG